MTQTNEQLLQVVRDALKNCEVRTKTGKAIGPHDEALSALAELEERLKDESEKYEDLIMRVSMKHSNETRHETAARYIESAENQPDQNQQESRDGS